MQGLCASLACCLGLVIAQAAPALADPAGESAFPVVADGPAQPLLLRIRPQGAPPEIGAGGGALPDAEAARRALAAREAVWERASVRARIAIASVCTGCLKPVPPAPAPLPEPVRAAPETLAAIGPADSTTGGDP
ncbi:hypothetical protein U8607_11570 [Methylobacterium durans]|uniref:hypothetical protein n=1 Tax=Methylobacterium durans TaxID=2202825 RepID=UPI002AFF0841|nr:hypothetical protein [Methylobacterium durans]MEA1832721.1 hypothetical protein [Methylobacterium durans]